MILPTKHLSEERSLLRIGAELLSLAEERKHCSLGCGQTSKHIDKKNLLISPVTYDWFVLALDLLIIIDAIQV